MFRSEDLFLVWGSGFARRVSVLGFRVLGAGLGLRKDLAIRV